MEKGVVPQTLTLQNLPSTRPQWRKSNMLGFLAVSFIFWLLLTSLPYCQFGHLIPEASGRTVSGHGDSWCPLPEAAVPRNDTLKGSEHLMSSEQLALQAERLSTAVRIPTESYDDSGDVDRDSRWVRFHDFHIALRQLFPLVYVNTRVTRLQSISN